MSSVFALCGILFMVLFNLERLNVLNAHGHSKTACLALTPVGIKDLRVTLGAEPSDLYVFSHHSRFYKLELGDCPEVEVIGTYFKSREVRR
jgi:hypothetical protein